MDPKVLSTHVGLEKEEEQETGNIARHPRYQIHAECAGLSLQFPKIFFQRFPQLLVALNALIPGIINWRHHATTYQWHVLIMPKNRFPICVEIIFEF
jgi:hypothetical protein